MRKYLLISHYNWDGDWGLDNALVFDNKEEAMIKKDQLVGYAIQDLKGGGNMVVDATDKENEYLEKLYENLDSGDLFYIENFGDSTIIAKYGWSSNNHEEWNIQEIEV